MALGPYMYQVCWSLREKVEYINDRLDLTHGLPLIVEETSAKTCTGIQPLYGKSILMPLFFCHMFEHAAA